MPSNYPAPPQDITQAVYSAAQQTGVDPGLLFGLIYSESGFNPNATSKVGAMGLAQLMPLTAQGLGVTNAYDPYQGALGGAKYLKAQLDKYGGDPSLAAAAYNAGPGAVDKYKGIPPYAETRQYVQNVLAAADHYRSNLPQMAPIPYDPNPQVTQPTQATTPATPPQTEGLLHLPVGPGLGKGISDSITSNLFPAHGDITFGQYWALVGTGIVLALIGVVWLIKPAATSVATTAAKVAPLAAL